MKNLFRLLLMAAVVMFVINAPPILSQQLETDYLRLWKTPETSQWKGVLKVYSVYGEARFDNSLLQQAVSKFEKANRGAFIQCRTMPAEEREETVGVYGSPDVWINYEGLTDSTENEALLYLQVEEEENVLTEDFEFDVEEEDEGEKPMFYSYSLSVDSGSRAPAMAESFCLKLREVVNSTKN